MSKKNRNRNNIITAPGILDQTPNMESNMESKQNMESNGYRQNMPMPQNREKRTNQMNFNTTREPTSVRGQNTIQEPNRGNNKEQEPPRKKKIVNILEDTANFLNDKNESIIINAIQKTLSTVFPSANNAIEETGVNAGKASCIQLLCQELLLLNIYKKQEAQMKELMQIAKDTGNLEEFKRLEEKDKKDKIMYAALVRRCYRLQRKIYCLHMVTTTINGPIPRIKDGWLRFKKVLETHRILVDLTQYKSHQKDLAFNLDGTLNAIKSLFIEVESVLKKEVLPTFGLLTQDKNQAAFEASIVNQFKLIVNKKSQTHEKDLVYIATLIMTAPESYENLFNAQQIKQINTYINECYFLLDILALVPFIDITWLYEMSEEHIGLTYNQFFSQPKGCSASSFANLIQAFESFMPNLYLFTSSTCITFSNSQISQ